MSFIQSEDDEGLLQVEICATLLTDKPPKLPLREELQSLGFEIIYNGRGVSEKTTRYESKRAVESYRRTEQIKELSKRRIFPKSAKKIRDKLLERQRIEVELKMPHAFSYESYEHQLYDDVESTSSSSGASSGRNPAKARYEQRKLVRGRKLFGMFRRSKSADDDVIIPISNRVCKDEQTLDDILSIAAFDDVLAESQDDIRVFPTVKKGSGKDTVTTVFSGGTSAGLLSGTYANGKRKDTPATSPSNMEIQFISSPVSDKYLPGLTTVKEAGGLDASVKDAFAGLMDTGANQGPNDSMSVRDVFENLSSSIYKGMPESPPKLTQAAERKVDDLSDAFDNVPADVYMVSVDGRSSDSQQRLASAIGGCGISSAVCVGTKLSKLTIPTSVETKDGWLNSALKAVLAKSEGDSDENHILGVQTGKSGNAISTISTEKATPDNGDDLVELAKTFGSDVNIKSVVPGFNKLSDLLDSKGSSREEVEGALAASPRLLRLRRDSDGRLPLHVICSRGLPNRTKIDATDLTKALVLDIENYKDLIEMVLKPFPEASLQLDKARDLPVHVLARNLMQWEAMWYEKVYAQASKEGEDPTGSTSADISRLYMMMSRTVETVLSPIACNSELCRKSGSVGIIFPLHIAAIFTSSVHTLRQILEAHPEAASRQCELGNLRTFVPDKSIPLQLHEGLSTDFPKWEEEGTHKSNPEISWSQDDSANPPQDWIRRSDLLFAFNPNVEPYRFENTRIRRLEELITLHTRTSIEQTSDLPHAIERLWSWMCTFQEEKSLRPTYVKSVHRIVDALPHRAIQALAAVKVDGVKTVLGAASPQCAKLIREALCDNAWNDDTSDGAWDGFQPSSLPEYWRREAALLCRSLFNIRDEAIPTSFVILPYKLALSPDGKTVLASESSATIAHKFSASLLHMTDPRSILYFLDMKSIKHYDQSIYESSGEDETVRQKTYSKIRDLEASLLGLYGFDSAYLYLVDEVTGAPVVPSADDSYPLALKEPASMVRKLLPMMMLGMVMMRGDKSLSVLVNVLLDLCVTKLPSNWLLVARELQSKLNASEARELESVLNLKKLKADLSDFLSSADKKRRLADTPRNGHTEWNVELSILKMLLDMRDKSHGFCGLKRRLVPGRGVVWSKDGSRIFVVSSSAGKGLRDKGELLETGESRDASPCLRDQNRVPTLEEVRRRCEAIRRTSDEAQRVPDLDELSKKHDELTRKFGNMHFRNYDDDSAEFPVESVDLPAKRSPKHDDSSSMQVVRANDDSSNSFEAVVFPQPQHDSSDEEARHFPTQRQPVRTSDDSETSDDELLRRTKLLLQRSQSPDLGKPTDRTSTCSSSSSSSASLEDPYEGRERHSLLFQALAFDPPIATHDEDRPRHRATHRPRSPSSSSAAPGAASRVVYQDVMTQLDGPKLQQDYGEVILLKVRLAQEAKKLEDINRRVSVAERQERLLAEREKELRIQLVASATTVAGSAWPGAEDECGGVDGNLSHARTLLVRLCGLEDRLLFSQIELQHIKLESYSLQVEIDDLTREPDPVPAPIVKARSDECCYLYTTKNRLAASTGEHQARQQRPRVRFSDQESVQERSCGSNNSNATALLSEIHLLPDDLSSSSAACVVAPNRFRHPRQQRDQPPQLHLHGLRGYGR